MIPNKIYLTQYDNGDSVRNTWSGEMFFCDDVEFIRKDILLGWARTLKESVENNEPFNDVKMGFATGMAALIDKLNSL